MSAGLVAVTGADGFIGRALCAHFGAAGRPRRGLVRAFAPGAPVRHDRLAVGDLATAAPEQLAAAVDAAYAVVHLAGRAHVLRESAPDPAAAYQAANVVATRRLAAAAARAGVRRFVLASTIKVHGEATPPGRPFRATDPLAPQDAYARSKAQAERALEEMCAGTGMMPVVLRLPLAYGPGVGGNFLALVDAVARGALLPLAAIDNRRDLLYVDNLAHAIAALLDSPESPAGAWLVADGEPVSTPDLVRRIAQALGVAPRLVAVPLPLLGLAARIVGRGQEWSRVAASLEVDASPLAGRIARPPHTLDAGLAATARWWHTRHAI